MHVTCKFGISGAYRLACRGGKRTKGAKHLHVHCTCTMHPSPFLVRHQVGNAKVHPRTEFGVASSKFTFTGGPLVKKVFRPLARATCTPQKWHPQWILSWHSMHVTCKFEISGASI